MPVGSCGLGRCGRVRLCDNVKTQKCPFPLYMLSPRLDRIPIRTGERSFPILPFRDRSGARGDRCQLQPIGNLTLDDSNTYLPPASKEHTCGQTGRRHSMCDAPLTNAGDLRGYSPRRRQKWHRLRLQRSPKAPIPTRVGIIVEASWRFVARSQQECLANDCFREQMIAFLPRFAAFGLSLTGNADFGGDLVQETCARALRHQAQWGAGTRLDGWMFR